VISKEGILILAHRDTAYTQSIVLSINDMLNLGVPYSVSTAS